MGMVPSSASASSISTTRQAPAVPKTYEPSWKKPPNPHSYINRNATAANDSAPAPFTSNVQPLQSPFFKKTATTTSSFSRPSTVNTVTVSPFSQSSASSTATVSSLSSNKPKTAPEISTHNPTSLVTTSNTTSLSTPSSSLTSKPLTAPSSTKPITTAAETTVAAESSVGSEKPTSSTIAPFKSTSKTTTPTATVRPLISKPILQNTTPNAASLIAKAPSTGVSQSSILATKEKESDPFKPPHHTSYMHHPHVM